METIEFDMRPTRADLNRLSIRILFMSKAFRFYLLLCILSLSIFLVLSETYQDNKFFSVLGFISFLGIICPFAGVLGIARKSYQSFWKRENRVFLVSPKGCGSRSDNVDIFVKWKAFDSIRETKNYILIKSKKDRRARFVIYKNLLVIETLTAIKKILADSPVPDKKLIA
ncbi:MAG: hypothetical protein OEW48_18085 [Phycisphaerae bacterium]|nr:hypothetical protein [Phycisphaerae bacterium]